MNWNRCSTVTSGFMLFMFLLSSGIVAQEKKANDKDVLVQRVEKELALIKDGNQRIALVRVKDYLTKSSTSLDLSALDLDQVPEVLWQLPDLVYLDLANNQIKEIPRQIKNLNQLKTLILSTNKITSLPSEITSLKQLEKIHIDANPIGRIDTEILDWLLPIDWRISTRTHVANVRLFLGDRVAAKNPQQSNWYLQQFFTQLDHKKLSGYLSHEIDVFAVDCAWQQAQLNVVKDREKAEQELAFFMGFLSAKLDFRFSHKFINQLMDHSYGSLKSGIWFSGESKKDLKFEISSNQETYSGLFPTHNSGFGSPKEFIHEGFVVKESNGVQKWKTKIPFAVTPNYWGAMPSPPDFIDPRPLCCDAVLSKDGKRIALIMCYDNGIYLIELDAIHGKFAGVYFFDRCWIQMPKRAE